jgi:hypothetical protein
LLKLTLSDFREIMRRFPQVRAPLADLAAARSEMNRNAVDEPDPQDAAT